MISVLIATYFRDDPEHLRAALASVIGQDMPVDEIVLVLDGDVPSVLMDVISGLSFDNLVVVKYCGNGKLGGALNFGLQFCSNEFVFRMDSDDICLPDRFRLQLEYLTAQSLDVCSSFIEEFHSVPGDLKRVRRCPVKLRRLYYSIFNPVNHMSVLFRKSCVVRAGGYLALDGFEDYYLWLRVLKSGGKLGCIPQVLVYARTNDNFLSRRSGLSYALKEFRAVFTFSVEGLIVVSSLPFWFFRVLIRLLPEQLLSLVYHFLRK